MSPGFDEVRTSLRAARGRADDGAQALEKLMTRAAENARRRLDRAACRLSPAHTATRVAKESARFSVTRAALDRAAAVSVEDARRRLSVISASLDALSPLAVLGRGYALVSDDEFGNLVRSTRAVKIGESLRVQLADGSLRCRVEEVMSDE